MIELILLRDLPNCPKGRVFKQNTNGSFFHSMTNEESIKGDFQNYHFTKNEIENMPSYFMLKDKAESSLSKLLSLSETEEEKPFFMVHVENRSSPTKRYDDYKEAYEEALRLSKKENQKTFVLKVCTEIEQVPSIKHFN